MPAKHARLTIEFELDSEPIAGSLREADGRATAFNGWIELVSLLQDAARTPVSRLDRFGSGHPRSRGARK